MDLSTMRLNVRRDLKDEDAGDYRWTDDELDRHIAHAVLDVSQALPLETKSSGIVIPTPAAKDIDISSLTNRVNIDAVEYPVDEDPRRYRRYTVWGDTLTLLISDTPTQGEAVNVYYGKTHTLGGTSTIPTHLEDLVALGASAYAGMEWAAYAINNLNVGGETTPKEFLKWSQSKLDFYRSELKRYGRHSRIRVRQLYADE